MLSDWFTVGAQIFNFLVLVWLLKGFAYRRILRAIDERESRIAAQLADAATREAQAREHLAASEAKLAEFEQQRETMLTEARADAEQQHAAMLTSAREGVQVLEAKWREDVDRDRQTFIEGLRRRVGSETMQIARRVIADLTGNELESALFRCFSAKSGRWTGTSRAGWARASCASAAQWTSPPSSRPSVCRPSRKVSDGRWCCDSSRLGPSVSVSSCGGTVGVLTGTPRLICRRWRKNSMRRLTKQVGPVQPRRRLADSRPRATVPAVRSRIPKYRRPRFQ